MSARAIIGALSVAVAAVTVTACGAGTQVGANTAKKVSCDFTPPKTHVTVHVLAYDSSAIDPYTNTMIASCSHSNVTISHDPIDFPGQDSKTPVTLAGKTGTYDLIEVYGAEMPNYDAKGKFQDLDALYAKYKDKYQLGGLNATMLDALKYDGKLYGLPMQANVTTWVYRKDVFASLGLPAPKTMADIRADAARIQKSGKMKYPVALPLSDPTTFFEAVMDAQGMTYRNPATGAATFNTAAAKKGWQAFKDLTPYMNPQVTSFDQPAVQQQLYSGQAAIADMYSGRMADLLNPQNSQYSKDFAFASITLDPGGKAVSNLSVDGWAIPSNTKLDPDMLFQIIASAVGTKASTNSLPYAYPARTSVIDQSKVPYAASVAQSLANGARSVPPHPWVTPIETQAAPILINSLKGTISVDAALAQCQAAATKILAGIPPNQ